MLCYNWLFISILIYQICNVDKLSWQKINAHLRTKKTQNFLKPKYVLERPVFHMTTDMSILNPLTHTLSKFGQYIISMQQFHPHTWNGQIKERNVVKFRW